MNKQILGFLIPMTGLLAITSPASALTQSFTTTYPGLNPSQSSQQSSEIVQLNQFNSSLGTLNSISVNLTGTTTFFIDGYNFTSSAETGVLTSASQALSVSLSSGSNALSTLASGTSTSGAFSATVPASSYGSLIGSSLTGSTFNQAQTNTFLSDFTGTSTSKVSLTIFADQPILNVAGNSTADSLASDSSTVANGSLTVTYTYTAAVPFDISANQVVFSLVPLFFGIKVIRKKMSV
jgi:hypothetical protein